MNIADRISILRKSKGISQEELADKIGVSRHEPVIIRLSQEKPINQGFALI